MGIPENLTCLMRNLYADQEATVRTRHGIRTASNFGKEYVNTAYCILLFNLHAEYIVWNAGLDESQAHTTLIVESEDFDQGERGEQKAGLKVNIEKSRIMAYII